MVVEQSSVMTKEKEKSTPDWDNSENWEVFEWEEALKYSDNLASRYFRMLERFGDLPDAEELIAAKLGEQNFFQFEDNDYDEAWFIDSCDDNNFGDDTIDGEFDTGDTIEPGDSLFYETSPVYQRGRQIALGWCNILASVLRAEDRFWGMTILFQLGRLLSYLSLSIGDGTFEHVNGSISFAKRAIDMVNRILGEIESKLRENTGYDAMFKIVREHLLETHDLLVDYLFDCKNRQEDDNKAD
jgi:hypothetical protein